MVGKQKGSRHVAGKLPVVLVNRAKARKLTPGRYSDGRGLMLEVRPGGASHWLQRLTVHGRRRDIGLGSLETTPLADARRDAEANHALARKGGDPLEARRERRAAITAPDFEGAARQCYEDRQGAWRNAKHQWQWLNTLETHVFPRLGKRRLDTITVADVLSVLTPIWTTKHETAKRVRQRIGLVLDYAKAKGWRKEGSPTREIGTALPKLQKVKQHQPAMPYADVPGFISNLRRSKAGYAVKDALELLILTAARTGEVIGMRLGELDLERAQWNVPGERMKASVPHTVPLAPRAVAILKGAIKRHSGKADIVFEAKAGKPLSNMALLAYMRRLGLEFVPHGFRSSFRDFAAERTNAPREVAEAALAHLVGNKVEAAYRRSTLLDLRRRLMVQWATFCEGGGAVVRLVSNG